LWGGIWGKAEKLRWEEKGCPGQREERILLLKKKKKVSRQRRMGASHIKGNIIKRCGPHRNSKNRKKRREHLKAIRVVPEKAKKRGSKERKKSEMLT